MLRRNDGSSVIGGRSRATQRISSALAITALILGVSPARSQVWGDDKTPSPSAMAPPEPAMMDAKHSAPQFFLDEMNGALVLRPAAALRHPPGVDGILVESFLLLAVGLGTEMLSDPGAQGPATFILGRIEYMLVERRIDPETDAFVKDKLKLTGSDIDWVSCGLKMERIRDSAGKELHRMRCRGATIRTFEPFDWLALVRRLDGAPIAANEGGRVYYKIEAARKSLGYDLVLLMVDDRTAWFESEDTVKKYLRRRDPAPPKFPAGPEWDRAGKGLFAISFDNHDGSLAKGFDPASPDDALSLSQIKDVERLILSVNDAAETILEARLDCRTGESAAAISLRAVLLAKLAKMYFGGGSALHDGVEGEDSFRLAMRALAANLRVERTERAVILRTKGLELLFALSDPSKAGMKRLIDPQNQAPKAESKTKKP